MEALTLATATEARFHFRCTNCFRRGRYSLATLKRQFGDDCPLAGLAHRVAEWRMCPNVRNPPLAAGASCGAHVDLAAMYLDLKREFEAHKHRRG